MNVYKITIGMILIVIALIIVPIVFAQETPVSPETTVSVSQPVNVRSGPGIQYTTLGTLYQSTDATGRNDFDTERVCRGNASTDLDMWLRIDFKGFEGWVARCAVDLSGDLDSLAVASAGHPSLIVDMERVISRPGEETEVEPDGDYVVGFTRERSNVRSAPNLDASVIDVTAAIEDIFVTGRNGDNTWVQVSYNGETGWMATYLILLPRNWQNAVPVK